MSSSHRECITSGISYAIEYPLQDGLNAPVFQNDNFPVNIPQQNIAICGKVPNKYIEEKPVQKFPIKPVLKSPKKDPPTTDSGKKVREVCVSEAAKKSICTKLEEKNLAKVSVHSNLKKKKTVAFGRTTNFSQTVEGADHHKTRVGSTDQGKCRNHSKKMEKVDIQKKFDTLEDRHKELVAKLEDLEKKDQERLNQLEDLIKKDKEREEQFLKLSDIVKCLVLRFSDRGSRRFQDIKSFGVSRIDTRKGDRRYRGKENVPPEVNEEENSNLNYYWPENQLRKFPEKTDEEEFVNNESDGKLKLIKRKMEEDPEFEQCINDIIARFSGEVTLTGTNQDIKKSMRCSKNTGYSNKNSKPDPSILTTTRVMKKMTVEKVQRSPARSALFSYDTTKYLARYGIACDNEDEDESCNQEDEAYDNHASLYRAGQSTTYYPPSKHRAAANMVKKKSCSRGLVRKLYPKHCENIQIEEEEDDYSESESLLNERIEVDNIFELIDDDDEEGNNGTEYSRKLGNRVPQRSNMRVLNRIVRH